MKFKCAVAANWIEMCCVWFEMTRPETLHIQRTVLQGDRCCMNLRTCDTSSKWSDPLRSSRVRVGALLGGNASYSCTAEDNQPYKRFGVNI